MLFLSCSSVEETHKYDEDNGKQSLIDPQKGNPHKAGKIHTLVTLRPDEETVNRL